MTFTRTTLWRLTADGWARPDRTPAPDPEPDGITPPDGMSLYWSDEFDGNAIDTSVWYQFENTYGDGNNELARLRAANITVAGGAATIRAKREAYAGEDFTSGFLSTKPSGTTASPRPDAARYFPRFGRYEIRAKLPHGQGLWPAFWLRHRDGASICEVDIMEYFHSQVPGRTHATIHRTNNAGSFQSGVKKGFGFFESPRYTGQGWHTWAMDILPEGSSVRFIAYIDGVELWSWLDTSATNWSTRYPGEGLFDICLNLAVGGNWVGHPDDPLGYSRWLNACIGPGGGTAPSSCSSSYGGHSAQAPNFTAGQSDYVIDYVRVFKVDGT